MTTLKSLRAAAVAVLAVAGLMGPALAQQEIKVGVPMATTGTFAFVGVPAVNAIKLAADELNAQKFFGDRKLTLLIEDNRSDTKEALALITRLVRRDNVLSVIGPISTGEAMAAGPVAVDLGVTMYTTATSLLVDVAAHRHTSVTVMFDLDIQPREARTVPSSLHLFAPTSAD